MRDSKRDTDVKNRILDSVEEGKGNPGIKPRSPVLQVDSSPAEPPGKPKNTGVGSLSLLQGNFPTQELNWRLLHCRQILFFFPFKLISLF